MKFCGIVGFWEGNIETSPGVFKPKIVEKKYTGDVYRNSNRFQPSSEQQNDVFTVNNQISILGDLYARRNWHSIRYVVWNDVCLKVTSVTVDYPRLTLDIGGEYNGARPERIT